MKILKQWLRGWLGLYGDQTVFIMKINALTVLTDSLQSQITELEKHKIIARNSIEGINAGLSSLHRRLYEMDERHDSLLSDVKALREFIVGCAGFSDRVVARLEKTEKKVAKYGKKAKSSKA